MKIYFRSITGIFCFGIVPDPLDCNFSMKSVDKFPILETHRRYVMAKHIYNTTPRITPFGTMRDVIFCSISKPSVIS